MLEQTSAMLRIAAFLHAALALAFGLWLFADATPIASHHPAWKPFKFALSIGLFLFTMAWLTPRLNVPAIARTCIDALLVGTMMVEMAVIGLQAMRGRASHFNDATPIDLLLWRAMMIAIVITSLTMLVVAILATLSPLMRSDGRAMRPVVELAWRAGLWLFLFVPLSGFTMGGRMTRFVGGTSEVGLPVLHWSTVQGDLRVAHFFAMHAIQFLVLLALALEYAAVQESLARSVLWCATVLGFALTTFTYAQALHGRPFLSRRASTSTSDTPDAP